MAVTKVFGTVDGVEVIMQCAQGDVWQVPVPLDQDGEYAVEVISEDEAGNRSYLARMLFCVDSSKLCIHTIPLKYYASILPAKYECRIIEPYCDRRGGG